MFHKQSEFNTLSQIALWFHSFFIVTTKLDIVFLWSQLGAKKGKKKEKNPELSVFDQNGPNYWDKTRMKAKTNLPPQRLILDRANKGRILK